MALISVCGWHTDLPYNSIGSHPFWFLCHTLDEEVAVEVIGGEKCSQVAAPANWTTLLHIDKPGLVPYKSKSWLIPNAALHEPFRCIGLRLLTLGESYACIGKIQMWEYPQGRLAPDWSYKMSVLRSVSGPEYA